MWISEEKRRERMLITNFFLWINYTVVIRYTFWALFETKQTLVKTRIFTGKSEIYPQFPQALSTTCSVRTLI